MALRRTTWAIVAWTVLWIVLFGVWLLNPDPTELRGALTTGPRLVGTTKPPNWEMFDFWFIGFAVLSAIWLVTRWRSGGGRRKS